MRVLLYVASTRAKRAGHVTANGKPSEWLRQRWSRFPFRMLSSYLTNSWRSNWTIVNSRMR